MNGRSGRPDLKNKEFIVKFHDNYRNLNGQKIIIEDLWVNVYGKSIFKSILDGNIAAICFVDRINYYIDFSYIALPELEFEFHDDTKILYGKINGLGYIVLLSELEEVSRK